MAILDHFRVLAETNTAEIRFCRVRDSSTGHELYLAAEPTDSHPLTPHPNITAMHPLGTEQQTRWLYGEIPLGPTLKDLWSAEALDEPELMTLVVQLVEGLLHLTHARPSLLPTVLLPEHVHRLGNGAWALDIAGLALATDPCTARDPNPAKALGALLHHLVGGDNPADNTSPTAHFSPALRLIMSRSLWGGFGSLDEVQDALRRLQRQEPPHRPVLPVRVQTLPPPSPSSSDDSSLALRPASRQFGKPTTTSRVTAGIAVVALLAVTVAVTSHLWPSRETGAQPLSQQRPPDGPAVPVPEPKSEDVAPATRTVATTTNLSTHSLDDVMAAEAVYHPSATEKTTPSATAPKKQPNTPAAPPASQSAPPKPETAPQDPIAALDKQAAGDNLVTVRFFGHPLGQAYMFTNPGAPVISLESFTSLLERPMTWELVGPKQLRLSAGKETFLTRDFVVLNNRIWLILRPELAGQLGLKVVSYGNQVLDLELKP